MWNNKYLISLYRWFKLTYIKFFYRNIEFGENVKIDWGTKIYNNYNHLKIGEGTYLRSIKTRYQAAMYFSTTILIDVKGARVVIGDNCRINGAYLHAQKSICLGNNCVVASGVNIMDSNGHEVYSLNRTQGRDKPKEIIIGNNVWIGLNSIILKGTSIGDNSIVAAGSVVKGEFPPNSIIQGNPAVVVKKIKFETV